MIRSSIIHATLAFLAAHSLAHVSNEESYNKVCPNGECLDSGANERACRLFVAESSIPNAGLGMFSGISLATGDEIHSEIVIQVLDTQQSLKLRKARTPNIHGLVDYNQDCRHWAENGECVANSPYMSVHCMKSCFDVDHGVPDIEISHSLLSSYYWASIIGHGTFLGDAVESILPGVGMMANSHPGLLNVGMTRPHYDNAGLDRRYDPGVGAFSSFHDYRFLAGKPIAAGQEIFAEYGDHWFQSREHKFGLIPLSSDYQIGDSIVRNFRKQVTDLELKGNYTFIEEIWSFVKDRLLKKNLRLQMTLPNHFATIEESGLDDFSVAMHSVPHVIRDIPWLNEHGRCMDGLRVAPSTITQAGRGAFATRDFRRGQSIYPAPVAHVERQALHMYKDTGDNSIIFDGEQLILNYCYGHPQSSLLLFPYSPVVNYINHNSEPNARLQWSTMNKHHDDWLELSTHEVLEKHSAGLIIEVVAIRDIREGEEIFIDYGDEWVSAWDKYVATWTPHNVTHGFVPVERLNAESKVRTEEEQVTEPYPGEVMTSCFFSKRTDIKTDGTNYLIKWDKDWSIADLMRQSLNALPCRILQRYYKFTTDSFVYTVRVDVSKDSPVNATEIDISDFPREAILFHYRPTQGDQLLKNVFRHEIQLPDDMVPNKWRDIKVANEATENYMTLAENDDYTSSECRFYLAESSIPDAGIGIFAGTDLSDGDTTQPDVCIHISDYDVQKKLQCELDEARCGDRDWMMKSYEWNSAMTHSNKDADYVSVFAPGLGAMGNFHPYFSDAIMVRPMKNNGGLKRLRDPAAGAISSYHGLHFQLRESIRKGMEIFISYGEDWLHDRESYLGKVPLKESYEKADLFVEKFISFLQKEERSIGRKAMTKFWSFIRQELTFDERVTSVLPDLDHLEEAARKGTAGYSLPVRTLDWLKSNGSCLDNIRSGNSSIKGIGMGAFARRSFSAGEVITTTPLIHLSRKDTIILKKNDENVIIPDGHQLILNYCYGHPKSSLLLLPYSPVVNYINHNNDTSLVNARMEWSTSILQKSDWLDRKVDDILKEVKSGLLIDIIAVKDIQKGDEIFLNYGEYWQNAWDQHKHRWSPKMNHVSVFELEKSERILKTKFEQRHEPYPSNILILCFVPDDIVQNSESRTGINGEEHLWRDSEDLLYYGHHGVPCDILSREHDNESNYLYSADVLIQGDHSIRVGKIPRDFIKFVDKPYTGDEHMEQTFRHEIGMSDDIFPQIWMDL